MPWIALLLLFLLVPVAVMLLLRGAGFPGRRPGAAIASGVLIGLLAGPLVGGRILPERYEGVFIGAVAEHEALRAMDRRHGADRAALLGTDVSAAAVAELEEQHRAERTRLTDAWERAKAVHARRLARCTALLIGAWTFVSGVLLGMHPRRARLGINGLGRTAPLAAAIVVYAILVMLVARTRPAQALLFGALMMIPALGPGIRGPRLSTARAGLLACFLVIGAVTLFEGVRAPWELFAAIPAFAVGACAGRAARGASSRAVRLCIDGLNAAICAFVVVRIDPGAMIGSASFWTYAIIAVFLASDGRWAVFWMMLRRETPRPWSMSASVVNAGAGPMAMVGALMLAMSGAVPTEMLGAVVLGTFAIESTRSLRLAVARSLDAGPASEAG